MSISAYYPKIRMKEIKWTSEYAKQWNHDYYLKHKERYIQHAIKNHWHDMIYCEYCEKSYMRKHWKKHLTAKTHLFNIEFGNGYIITCKSCNVSILRVGYKTHLKTKMHIKNLEV